MSWSCLKCVKHKPESVFETEKKREKKNSCFAKLCRYKQQFLGSRGRKRSSQGVSAGLDMKKEEEEEEKKGARHTLGSDIRDKVTPIHPPPTLTFLCGEVRRAPEVVGGVGGWGRCLHLEYVKTTP